MKKRSAILIITISILLLINAGIFNRSFIKIHFIDVGYGEAILIQSSGWCALVDSGTLLKGYEIVDYLKRQGVSRIDHLILTHPDLDHISGAFFILPKFKVKNIYDNGEKLPQDDIIYRWYDELVRKDAGYAVLRRGGRLKLKDINLDVLWPPDTQAGSFNENSLVIKLSFNNFSCLLTADLNKISEEKLLKEGSDLKSNILKIGHHGRDDATSQGFLDSVSAEVAIISTDNSREELLDLTLATLRKKNMKVYRTDTNGTIIVTVDNRGNYKIKTER
ncbi:MAG: MBL fold metallo-hydrolase [Candidatus Omnitrophica bacterium]|nr:MBL fold metallo-hydrolase [Candidatus Omnitrophota bacterium]